LLTRLWICEVKHLWLQLCLFCSGLKDTFDDQWWFQYRLFTQILFYRHRMDNWVAQRILLNNWNRLNLRSLETSDLMDTLQYIIRRKFLCHYSKVHCEWWFPAHNASIPVVACDLHLDVMTEIVFHLCVLIINGL
jgi:hypothetical protein